MASRNKYRFPDRKAAEDAYSEQKERNLLLYWFVREFHLGRIKPEDGIPAYANVECRYSEENPVAPETWTATVYKYYSPSQNEKAIVCYSFGGSSFEIGELWDTLAEWDRCGADITNSYYQTYWKIARAVREALNNTTQPA